MTAQVVKYESAEARTTRLAVNHAGNVSLITKALCDELGLSDKAREVLTPWLRDRILGTLRKNALADWSRLKLQARARQGRDRAAGSAVTHPKSGPNPELNPELTFLDCRIIMAGVPNGYKLYRHLTATEHRDRGLRFSKTAKALSHSARSHDWAADMITKHGVTCLDDIGLDVLLKELPRDEGIRP